LSPTGLFAGGMMTASSLAASPKRGGDSRRARENEWTLRYALLSSDLVGLATHPPTREVSEAPASGIRFRRTAELRIKHLPAAVELFEPLEDDQPLGVIADGIRVDLRQHAPGLEGVSVLAVLPLRNDTGDLSLESVARGFSEDHILALSHTRQFPVVDRNSSFAYRSGDLSSLRFKSAISRSPRPQTS